MMIVKISDKFKLNAVERKFRKLKRDPDLFFKDMVSNKKNQVESTVVKLRILKPETKFKYTIVSAVYNVSKYLDEYFESIVSQSIDFKKSIHIICVDDGSTDNSADIIKKWQKKYPNNIRYIYKNNGGQSSARNLGLEYVKTDWVLFTDPDDFFHLNYIRNIDLALQNNNTIKMLVTNMVFYFEDQNLKKDTHPLRYRFHGETTTFDIKKLEENMNLSAATSVFNVSEIKKNKLRFNPEVRPVFEDGKFIADYMLAVDGHITFLKNAIYYYRKRSDSSSTLDTAWLKPEKFHNVLKYGHLDMLMSYQKKLGFVPPHIQRTALYDMAWYVNYLINNDSRVSFLSQNKKDEFLRLIKTIFSYIDNEVILDFELAKIWFMHKVAMLGFFKNTEPKNYIAYIENVDRENNQILISYYIYQNQNVSYRLNNQDVLPCCLKTVKNTFVGQDFVYEKRAWISYESLTDKIEVFINKRKIKISLFGKQHTNGLIVSHILEKFSPSLNYNTDDSWVLMDRNTQADDNAEHLYRYILENNLKQNCYFALNRDSSDWTRLEQEGFKLLEFGSDDFEIKLKHCSKIISSHLDRYVNNYFGDEYEYSKKFVFLQHGITKDDMSSWFNGKKNLQCLITATQPEYQSMISNNTRYKLTEKEVVLTGFPRHDKLLKQNLDEKTILIMPTWRNTIVGKTIGDGNERALNDAFMETLFAQSWYKLIHSPQLKHLVNHYGYKVIFAPHANIEPYLDQFDIPSYMSIWSVHNQEGSIQKLFQKAKIMLTDYSSVAFEMAYLDKAIIYYQFDKDIIYQGSHIYQKGYFEYERDGFGPVVEEVDQVNSELAHILENNGRPLPMYLKRMQDTFKFKDGRCCERVYQAILDLDRKDESFNLELAQQFLQQAYDAQDFSLVEERANHLLMRGELTEAQKVTIKHLLAEAYLNLQDWKALESLLNEIHIEFYQLKLMAYQNKWTDILELLGSDAVVDQNMDVRMSMLFNLKDFNDELAQYNALMHAQDDIKLEQYLLAQCYIHYINQEWTLVSDSIARFKAHMIEHSMKIESYTQDDLTYMQMMADKYLNQIDINLLLESNSCTLDFEVQKALTLSEYSKAKEACALFKQIESENGLGAFDQDALHAYAASLFQLKDWTHLKDLLDFVLCNQFDSIQFIEYYVETLFNLKQYAAVVEFVKATNFDVRQTQRHMIVLAHYRLGLIEEAYELLIEPSIEFDYSYWVLALEIYMQTGHEQQVIDCVRRMYAIFPDKLKETKKKYDNLSKLFDLI